MVFRYKSLFPLFFLLIYFTVSQNTYSQRNQWRTVITGSVTDNDGHPLSGVLVQVQGAESGVRTNSEGIYILPFSNSSQALWHGVLIFSYTGFEAQTVRTLNHRRIDIKLIPLTREQKALHLPPPQLMTNSKGIYTETCWDLDLMKYNFTRPSDDPPPPGDKYDPIFTGETGSIPPVIGEYTLEAGEDRSINTFGKNFTMLGKNNMDTKVWIYRQTTINDARLYSASLIGERTDYLVATVDAGEPYGMYLMWIENENGYSYPVRINATYATWLGPDHITLGGIVNIYGQNLSRENGTQESHVFLRPWGSGPDIKSMPVTVTHVNPYKVSFIIPDNLDSDTDYEVWVHNGHGGRYGWSGPLKLHIDKLNPLVWSGKTLSVKDFGAIGDGIHDDSGAIQHAINSAEDGDKVYFPAGTYRLVSNGIECNKKLSLEGEGSDITVLLTDSSFIKSEMLHVSDFPSRIQNLKFKTFKPDRKGLAILVHAEGSANGSKPKGFLVRKSSFETAAFGGNSMSVGYGINCLNIERIRDVLVINNEFITQVSVSAYACEEVFINNNRIYGNWKVTHGNGNLLMGFPANIKQMDISNNFMQSVDHLGSVDDGDEIIVRAIVFQNWHGGRHNRIYIGENTIDRAGSPWDNSGEIILFELPTSKTVYNPESVEKTTMKLSRSWPDNSLTEQTLAIIKNKGIGQFRRIIANHDNQVTLDKPWDIEPDINSVVSINSSADNVVIYDNNVNGIPNYYDQESATSGIQFYGAAFNNVIARNTFRNVHYGIYITGFAADPSAEAGHSTGCMGTLVTGNTVVNAVYGLEAITVMYPEVMPADLPDEIPWSSNVNTVMRDNTLTHIRNFSVNSVDYGGYGILVGQIYNDWQDPIWNGPWVREILVEHNYIADAADKYVWLRQHQEYTTVRKNYFTDNTKNPGVSGVFFSAGNKNASVLDNYFDKSIVERYAGTLPGPRMQLSQRSLRFNVTDKQKYEVKKISIKNAGTGALDLSISHDAEWIHSFLDDSYVYEKRDHSLLSVKVNALGLAAGTYRGTITIQNATDGSFQSVGVEMIIQ